MKSQLYKIKTNTGTLVFNMIDDNVADIVEDQNNQIMESNKLLGLAGKTELF